jgi:hypothetical protein
VPRRRSPVKTWSGCWALLACVVLLATPDAGASDDDCYSCTSCPPECGGDAPEEEWSCEDLDGALHGLCVAYCVALDCTAAGEASPACARVAERFHALAEVGQEIPCEGPHP